MASTRASQRASQKAKIQKSGASQVSRYPPKTVTVQLSEILKQLHDAIQAAAGVEGEIRLSQDVISALTEALRSIRHNEQEIKAADISALLAVLEHEENDYCLRLEADLFVAILETIMNAEYCRGGERLAYLLTDALHHFSAEDGDDVGEQSKIVLIGLKCLEGCVQHLVDTAKDPRIRRWLGLLLLRMIENSKEVREAFIFGSDELRHSVGTVLCENTDEVVRMICGHIVRVVVNTGKERRVMWPESVSGDAYENFPIESQHSQNPESWKRAFSTWVDEVWDRRGGPMQDQSLYCCYEMTTMPPSKFGLKGNCMEVTIQSEYINIFGFTLQEAYHHNLEVPMNLLQKVSIEHPDQQLPENNQRYADVILHIRDAANDFCYLDSKPKKFQRVGLTISRDTAESFVTDMRYYHPTAEYPSRDVGEEDSQELESQAQGLVNRRIQASSAADAISLMSGEEPSPEADAKLRSNNSQSRESISLDFSRSALRSAQDLQQDEMSAREEREADTSEKATLSDNTPSQSRENGPRGQRLSEQGRPSLASGDQHSPEHDPSQAPVQEDIGPSINVNEYRQVEELMKPPRTGKFRSSPRLLAQRNSKSPTKAKEPSQSAKAVARNSKSKNKLGTQNEQIARQPKVSTVSPTLGGHSTDQKSLFTSQLSAKASTQNAKGGSTSTDSLTKLTSPDLDDASTPEQTAVSSPSKPRKQVHSEEISAATKEAHVSIPSGSRTLPTKVAKLQAKSPLLSSSKMQKSSAITTAVKGKGREMTKQPEEQPLSKSSAKPFGKALEDELWDVPTEPEEEHANLATSRPNKKVSKKPEPSRPVRGKAASKATKQSKSEHQSAPAVLDYPSYAPRKSQRAAAAQANSQLSVQMRDAEREDDWDLFVQPTKAAPKSLSYQKKTHSQSSASKVIATPTEVAVSSLRVALPAPAPDDTQEVAASRQWEVQTLGTPVGKHSQLDVSSEYEAAEVLEKPTSNTPDFIEASKSGPTTRTSMHDYAYNLGRIVDDISSPASNLPGENSGNDHREPGSVRKKLIDTSSKAMATQAQMILIQESANSMKHANNVEASLEEVDVTPLDDPEVIATSKDAADSGLMTAPASKSRQPKAAFTPPNMVSKRRAAIETLSSTKRRRSNIEDSDVERSVVASKEQVIASRGATANGNENDPVEEAIENRNRPPSDKRTSSGGVSRGAGDDSPLFEASIVTSTRKVASSGKMLVASGKRGKKKSSMSPIRRSPRLAAQGKESSTVTKADSSKPLLDDKLVRKPQVISFGLKGAINQGPPSTLKFPAELVRTSGILSGHTHNVDQKRKRNTQSFEPESESRPKKRQSISPEHTLAAKFEQADTQMVDSSSPIPERFSNSQGCRVDANGSPISARQVSQIDHIGILQRRLSKEAPTAVPNVGSSIAETSHVRHERLSEVAANKYRLAPPVAEHNVRKCDSPLAVSAALSPANSSNRPYVRPREVRIREFEMAPPVAQHRAKAPGQFEGLEILRPQLPQPELPQPELLQPELLQPELLQPEILQPEIFQPELLQTDLRQPEVLRSILPQPELLQSNILHPELLPHEGLETESLRHGSLQPASLQPGSPQPGSLQPRSLQPGSLQPESIQSEIAAPYQGHALENQDNRREAPNLEPQTAPVSLQTPTHNVNGRDFRVQKPEMTALISKQIFSRQDDPRISPVSNFEMAPLLSKENLTHKGESRGLRRDIIQAAARAPLEKDSRYEEAPRKLQSHEVLTAPPLEQVSSNGDMRKVHDREIGAASALEQHLGYEDAGKDLRTHPPLEQGPSYRKDAYTEPQSNQFPKAHLIMEQNLSFADEHRALQGLEDQTAPSNAEQRLRQDRNHQDPRVRGHEMTRPFAEQDSRRHEYRRVSRSRQVWGSPGISGHKIRHSPNATSYQFRGMPDRNERFGTRRTSSGISKLKPAPPGDIDSRYVAHEDIDGTYEGVATKELIAPGKALADPFIGKLERRSSGFTQRLQAKMSREPELKVRRARASLPRKDLDRTLVETGKQQEQYFKATSPSEMSFSTSSSSYSERDQSEAPLHESSPNRRWNMAVRAHYHVYDEAVHRAVDDVLIRLHDEEDQLALIVNQYQQNGTKIVKDVLRDRARDQNAIREALEKKREAAVQDYTKAGESVSELAVTLNGSTVGGFEKLWQEQQAAIQEQILEGQRSEDF